MEVSIEKSFDTIKSNWQDVPEKTQERDQNFADITTNLNEAYEESNNIVKLLANKNEDFHKIGY